MWGYLPLIFEFSPIQNVAILMFIMGRPILIMGEVTESNLSEIDCLAIQNAHLKWSLFQFLVIIKLISDILRISDVTETWSRSAEGCDETAAISRADQYQPPCCRLWRHNRTVVTPLASLLSHLFRLVMLLLAIGSHIGPSSLRVVEQIIISTTFCSLFFLYNLIEAIFSPTFRKSLIEFFMFDRSGPVYQIANI